MTKLERLHEALSDDLDAVLARFKAGAKVTLVVRATPGNSESDVVIGNDDLEEAAAAIRRRQAGPNHFDTGPLPAR